MLHERLLDYLMFRQYDPERDSKKEPLITTGSIVYGFLLRMLIVMILSLSLTSYIDFYANWFIALFLVWMIAAFPAYRQYQIFNENIEKLSEETLCGKCAHFDASNQLCKITDIHVSEDAPPCEGELWEPSKKALGKNNEENYN